MSAAFALNLLTRLNRDLAGSFEETAFRYQAVWKPEHSHIEMALVSQKQQQVKLAGQVWTLPRGKR